MTDRGQLKVNNLEIWKTDCPEIALENNDLFVDAAGSSGGWGDPLDRDPALVIADLNSGVCPDYDFVSRMHGVVASADSNGLWQLDEEATANKRQALRQARLDESMPVADWWQQERQRVQATDFVPEVLEMYTQSLSFEKFRGEFTNFWQLPGDYCVAED